jgi:hypothetical protein
MGLRPQGGDCHTRLLPQSVKCCADQGCAKPRAPQAGPHTDTANLARRTLDQQPRGADRGIAIMGQQVDCGVVLIVQLIRLTDALLDDEDLTPQGAAGCDVAGDLDTDHAK